MDTTSFKQQIDEDIKLIQEDYILHDTINDEFDVMDNGEKKKLLKDLEAVSLNNSASFSLSFTKTSQLMAPYSTPHHPALIY